MVVSTKHFQWRGLGSLKLTIVLLLLLLVAVWLAYQLDWNYQLSGWSPWLLAPVMVLLVVNLLVAIISNARFRRQPSLLIFHIALVAIVALIGLGRLVYLKGWVEVTSGGEFSGQLTASESGPWHPWHGRGLRFTNNRFEIHYSPGPRRGPTYNWVSWPDDSGNIQQAVIGDQTPLDLQGYRFYTSHNKGFAPVFLWKAHSSRSAKMGVIHLPAYPAHEHSQALEWSPPGSSQTLWFKLEFDEVILPPEQDSQFHAPSDNRLIVRVGERRSVLLPGQSLVIDEGELVYQGLRTWMGYNVYYDPTRYWLLAACLLAVGSICLFFWQKYSRNSWLN